MSRKPAPLRKAPAPRKAPKKTGARRRETASIGRRLIAMGVGGLTILGVVAMLAVLGGLWVYQGPGPAAKSGEATNVVLRRGASLPEIASTLEQAGVIRSSSLFLTAAQTTGAARRLKAGEYEFPTHASLREVLAKIRDGKIVRHHVTVAEGLTSDMVVDILMRAPELTGTVPTPPEGSILPETYQVVRGEDRAAVLQRMMDDRDALLDKLWADRQPGLPFATKDQAVTMASIVEKETGLASERPHVAAVFINRLRQGVRLGSDPTIIYGLTRGRPLGRGILLSELQRQTPYNTYLIDGLPPTPIANPGKAALAAVLNPMNSDDLYFVADGTGGHVFASTYEEHERNVAKWRQVERSKAAATPQKTPLSGG
ncbi:endolytic transglycosylase MltG [Caulobacter sp. DWR2-3-1b2]|uniref:endolytic transglycosylase MltG n=1 Tax=unclassified Caulobacter TaxID=2648921 RepID=UPI003CF741C4